MFTEKCEQRIHCGGYYILKRQFLCNGYQYISSDLRDKNYSINHKKAYRLMDENNLLLERVSNKGKREFVRQRKIQAAYPKESLFPDIKIIWVAGENDRFYLNCKYL